MQLPPGPPGGGGGGGGGGPQLQQSRLFHSWPPLAMYLYWGVFIWYTKYIWRLCWLFGSVQCVFLVLWVVFGILDGVFRSFHPPALSTAATSAPQPSHLRRSVCCVSGEEEGGIVCAPPLLPLLLHSAHHKDSMYVMTLGNWNGRACLTVRNSENHCVFLRYEIENRLRAV